MQEHTALPLPLPQLTAAAPLTEVLRPGRTTTLETSHSGRHCRAVSPLCGPPRSPPQDRLAVARHGYLPEREMQTGLGAVRVQVPRVRARRGLGMRWHSALVPPIAGGRKAWRRCGPGCASQASRPGIAPRRSRPSWGQRPQGSPRRRLAGSHRAGRRR